MLPAGQSITRKLTRVIMATSAITLVLTCGIFLTYELVTYKRRVATAFETQARIIAGTATATLAFEDQASAHEILSGFKEDWHVVAAAFYGTNGLIFAAYPSNGPPSLFPSKVASKPYFEKSHLIIFQPVVEEGKRLGTLFMRADLGALKDRVKAYGGIVILILGGSLLLAYFLSTGLQRRISEPILALVHAARTVSEAKDYSVRAPKMAEDELGTLTDAFNHMLSQIREREVALRENSEEIRRLNAELEDRVRRRTAELAESNQELEAFTYSVSHDLRAPLRHIDGYAQVLQDEYTVELPAQAKEYLRRIRRGTSNMGQLVDDLLHFARLGRQELNRQETPLQALVLEVLADLKPEVANRDIEFIVGDLPVVQCDPALLKQVFANLLANAAKYTRPRPKGMVEIGQDINRVVFVRDNGVGFNMKYADKLFGVFQRLHRIEEFEGTG
ncbi:MAG TPA: histidine kinase dimerization/phospho-acceptor domain-containing protein, partial [Verrucomicrobiae bacterium]|nr:histidine kinase dimerization/phospho-acceptor domain-containing protein [Verrucomicrobiae bacterium]